MGPAPLVLSAAALAGTATLAVELLWLRALARSAGTTADVTIVTAGLLLTGVSAGGMLGARWAARSTRPARAAALCLLAGGTLTALSPLYLDLLPALLAQWFGAADGGLASRVGSVVLPALPLVLPGALLLGLVVPLCVRLRVLDVGRAGTRVGVVFAVCAAGAAAGVAATLVLLPSIGEAMTLRFAGAAALVGALCLLLVDKPRPDGVGRPDPATVGHAPAGASVGTVLLGLGAAGALAFLAWLRLLQPVLGPHLPGFGVLLVPALVAIAAGAAIAGWAADRIRSVDVALGVVLAAAGLLTALSLPLATGLPARLLCATGPEGEGSGRLGALAWGLLSAYGPALFALGAALPLAVRVRVHGTGDAERAAARVCAWTALGSVVGGVLAGMLLLPALGPEVGLLIAAAGLFVTAAAQRLRLPGPGRRALAACHLVPLAALLWPGLFATLAGSGPPLAEILAARNPLPPGLALGDREDVRLYAAWFAADAAAQGEPTGGTAAQALQGRTGRLQTIAEPGGRTGLYDGARLVSSFATDRPDLPPQDETLLGLLPGLLHPAAQRVLVAGHGAGWTAEAALVTGAGHVEVSDLDTRVLAAVRAHRGLDRLPIEADPRGRLVDLPARVLLRAAAAPGLGRRYDWIAIPAWQPWCTQFSHLVTREALAAAREALREGGILALGLGLSDLSDDLLRAALASCRDVFDHVWAFRVPDGLILLGFRGPPQVRPDRWQAHLSGAGPCAVFARAAGFGNPGEVWKHFTLDTQGVDRVLAENEAMLHDDVPWLEFDLGWRQLTGAAPRSVANLLRAGFPPDMAAALPAPAVRERWLADAVLGWLREDRRAEADEWSRRLRWGATAEGCFAQGLAALRHRGPARAENLLAQAAALAPARGDIVAHWIRALESRAVPARRGDPALRQIDRLAERFPNDGRVLAAAAHAHRSAGSESAAHEYFARAVQAHEPDAPPGTGVQLARLLLAHAFGAAQERHALVLLANDPATFDGVDALDMFMRLVSLAGDEKRAEGIERALANLQRTQGQAHLRRATGLMVRHEFEEAVEAAETCRRIWSYEARAWELEGLARLAAQGAKRAASGDASFDAGAAADALRDAVERAEDEQAATDRARRMLRWYGQPAALLESIPPSRGE